MRIPVDRYVILRNYNVMTNEAFGWDEEEPTVIDQAPLRYTLATGDDVVRCRGMYTGSDAETVRTFRAGCGVTQQELPAVSFELLRSYA